MLHTLLLISPASAITLEDIQPSLWTSAYNQTTLSDQGTCSSAVDVMMYHRDKMNEYLCRRYLAQEIAGADETSVMEDRSLRPLKEDSGSIGYKDWLARSTTLEDLYRHYEQTPAEDAPIGAQLPLAGEYDGEVTGYAMLGNKVAADTSGYGGGSSYGVPTYGGGVSKAGSEKGMKLNELFQLALTAIAFLAFGTFIIEVIMCVMGLETKENDMEIMMVTPEPLQSMSYYKMQDGSQARSGRSLQRHLGGMAAHATASLNGFDILHRDDGRMLLRSLCEANVYSGTLSGTDRIWLPLWSFGMSWIGGRHLARVTNAPLGTLKLLTASIQGMAGVNCSLHVI